VSKAGSSSRKVGGGARGAGAVDEEGEVTMVGGVGEERKESDAYARIRMVGASAMLINKTWA
jgi:hypothetical protein